MQAARGLFVTGTDTDVGKTAVAVAILRDLVAHGRRAGAYKPVASGVRPGVPGDAERLWEAAGRPLTSAAVCPQSFAAALAPAAAARLEGRAVDERLLRDGVAPWRTACEIVVVEGAGGLFSPLGPRSLGVDVARDLAFPLVIVDGVRLGLVGRTLATVRAARAEGLTVAAVVLSHVRPPAGRADEPEGDTRLAEDGLAMLAAWLPGVTLGVLAHGADRMAPAIDWFALAAGPT